MIKSKEIPIHDFVSDNKDSIPFRYISIGALANYDFSLPHRHNYYEIFFFSKGGGDHFIDFKSYPIQDHSIHFVSPGQVHLVKRALDSFGSIIMFSRDFFHTDTDVKNTLFNFPFLNNSRHPLLTLTKPEYEVFESILRQVQNESERDHEVFKGILRSYLNIILLKCLQFFDTAYPEQKSKQGTMFNHFREMVEKEYRIQKKPVYYASRLNISEKKLNEICKEHRGENVGEYIKNRVLLEAQRLLINTDHSIKEIAYFLGFEDPSYFNRFFKSNAGSTAGDFRNSGKTSY